MEREVHKMKDNTLTMLKYASVDVETTLDRFCGNSILYKNFLGRFLQDDNFKKIGKAVEAEDENEMLTAAHTLKGVAGNLGFAALMDACDKMIKRLRSEDMAGAKAAYSDVKENYEKVCSIINSMEEFGG